jgi:hypothetical protein
MGSVPLFAGARATSLWLGCLSVADVRGIGHSDGTLYIYLNFVRPQHMLVASVSHSAAGWARGPATAGGSRPTHRRGA